MNESINNKITWLKAHERIIIVALVLAAGCFLGSKWLDKRADAAEHRAIVAEQIAKDAQDKVKLLTEATAEANAKYVAVIDMLTKQNQSLVAGITARNQQLAQQQQAVQNMTLPEVGERWKVLAKLPEGSLTAKPDKIEVSPEAAKATVTELEKVPVLEANLADTNKIVENKNKALGEADNVISTQKTEIAGLKDLQVKKDAACKADVDNVKAQAAKSKRNWFVRGLVVGGTIAGYVLTVLH